MKLRPLQRSAFYYAQTVDHPAFFLTMRAGKALLTIKDIVYNNVFPALICAPLSTIFGWEQDLLKFGCTKNDYEIIIGRKKQKQKKIVNKSFIITNKEFYLSIPELIQKIDFKSICLDESTCIKNYKTEISKYFIKNFKNIKRKYILSGTPMTNSEMDIYCQLQFLDSSILNFKNFWDFKNYFFYQVWKYEWKLKSYRKTQFYQTLNKKCHFVTLNDVRNSIKKENLKTERIIRSIILKPKIKEIYKKLKDDFIVSIDGKNLFGFQYVLQQLIYLRKLCSGFITLNPETKETKLIDLSKYTLLMDIINNEIPNYKIIILCNFYDEINQITKLFQQSNKKFAIITGKTKSELRGKYTWDFQNNKIQYLIANTQCLKFGVTLSNADLTIVFSTILGEITRTQVELRGTDIYTDNNLLIMHLIVDNSVEKYFYDKIKKQISKNKLIDELLNYLNKDTI